MADVHHVRLCVFIFMALSISYLVESCEVNILSPVGKTRQMSVNGWFNVTFRLDNCGDQTYLITIERKEQNRPVILCRIHHNKTCIKTSKETMYSCRCVSPSGPVEFWDKLVRPGDVEYRWRWIDVSSGKQGEKKNNLHVTTGDKTNAQGVKMVNVILGGTCGLLVVVVAVVFLSARCQTSSPPATTENRKGQHTQLGSAQPTRPNPQTQAPVPARNYRDQTRCNEPSTVEDEYARVVRDQRRKPPAPRQVEQQASMEMFINDLYDEKAL